MAMWFGSLVGLIAILSCCFCNIKAAPAYFVFGDSLMDNRNNNCIGTIARANSYPYEIDYPTGRPTDRFSNGLNIADFISTYQVISSPTLTGDAFIRGANFASAGVGILNNTRVQFV
ncbi:hypothetical protein SUGI_0245110 [Cryptomeria japonica]|nr:hypothetical protein SUGI_0245110 [Cryptomeria japonica]